MDELTLKMLDAKYKTAKDFLEEYLDFIKEPLREKIIERELEECQVSPDTKPSEYLFSCYRPENVEEFDFYRDKNWLMETPVDDICIRATTEKFLSNVVCDVIRDEVANTVGEHGMESIPDWILSNIDWILTNKYRFIEGWWEEKCEDGECEIDEDNYFEDVCYSHYDGYHGYVVLSCPMDREPLNVWNWSDIYSDISNYTEADIVDLGYDMHLDNFDAEKLVNRFVENIADDYVDEFIENITGGKGLPYMQEYCDKSVDNSNEYFCSKFEIREVS